MLPVNVGHGGISVTGENLFQNTNQHKEELGGEPLLLRMERSQPRRLGHLLDLWRAVPGLCHQEETLRKSLTVTGIRDALSGGLPSQCPAWTVRCDRTRCTRAGKASLTSTRSSCSLLQWTIFTLFICQSCNLFLIFTWRSFSVFCPAPVFRLDAVGMTTACCGHEQSADTQVLVLESGRRYSGPVQQGTFPGLVCTAASSARLISPPVCVTIDSAELMVNDFHRHM